MSLFLRGLKFLKAIAGRVVSKSLQSVFRNKKITLAYYLNELGVRLIVLSKRMMLKINSFAVDKHIVENQDRFLLLHKNIDSEIKKQRRFYSSYKYFAGYPYQQLSILNTFGDRNTEERFDNYGLSSLITHKDTVLDIG